MTDAQQYTIKEMLEKMEDRSILERAETNKKIDNIHNDLNEFRTESRRADKEQDGRIKDVELWKGGVMAVIKYSMWIISGLGGLTGIYFLLIK